MDIDGLGEKIIDQLMDQGLVKELAGRGLLHVLQVTRDCDTNESIEILACSVNAQAKAGAH